MKGKWAKGIAPRFFAWIIKDQLAVSERPGGYARNHRRVRRQEEILWLRGEGFTRVVSLLTSPHNLHAYDELDMAWAHIPFGPHDDPSLVLPDLYGQLREWMSSGEQLLVHHEELSDRLMGVVAGYLRWSGMVTEGPQAISVVERIMHRQMGPDGRELVAMALQLAGAGGCRGTVRVRGRTSEESPPRVREVVPSRAVAAEVVTPTRVDRAPVAVDDEVATANEARAGESARPAESADVVPAALVEPAERADAADAAEPAALVEPAEPVERADAAEMADATEGAHVEPVEPVEILPHPGIAPPEAAYGLEVAAADGAPHGGVPVELEGHEVHLVDLSRGARAEIYGDGERRPG